jgi:hypothetical protein
LTGLTLLVTSDDSTFESEDKKGRKELSDLDNHDVTKLWLDSSCLVMEWLFTIESS